MAPADHSMRFVRRVLTSVLQIVFLLAGFGFATTASATVQYTVSLAKPEQHFFHVTMRIAPAHKKVIVQLPAWNALYQIRDFAHRVAGLQAQNQAGHALTISKLDKQTWLVMGDGALEIKYDIYWDDPGPFNSQLNAAHAFLNLGEVLLYIPDRRKERAEVQLLEIPEQWSVATSLKKELRQQETLYIASGYDELVDAPIEISHFQTITIREREPRIIAVIHGDSWKPAQIIEPLQKICTYEMHLMGGAPFDEYTFIYHIGTAAGGGGMEHADSTAISLASAQTLPGISAHEFFHLWNVKRIRPQSLEPVDYTQEMWTRSLWFAEGVTSTYAAYTLLRTGIWTKEVFYGELGGQITELELRPASHWKSVEEASLDAWLEKYPLYDLPALSISYYNKGQILGVLLDILIRDATNNRKSLDDMMRALNEEFARNGKFYKDVDLRLIAEKMSGRRLEEWFARYVSGSDEFPYQDIFARAGLTVNTAQHEVATFGFWPKRSASDGFTVSALDPEEPAARAGLREGDVLIALNGAPFPTRGERWLREHAARETVKVRFRRGTEEKEVTFALAGHIQRTDQIEELPHPTAKQLSIRQGILRGITEDSAWQ